MKQYFAFSKYKHKYLIKSLCDFHKTCTIWFNFSDCQVWNDNLERQAKRRLRIHCRSPFISIQDSDPHSNIARHSEGDFIRDIQTWYSEIRTPSFIADYEPTYGICFPEEGCYHATTVSMKQLLISSAICIESSLWTVFLSNGNKGWG